MDEKKINEKLIKEFSEYVEEALKALKKSLKK